MKKQQSGFTLIELMIVVAIIGILAAIAIPSYMDYTKKARVSEVMLATAPYKLAVSETYASNADGTLPADNDAAGAQDFDPTGATKSVTIASGGVVSAVANPTSIGDLSLTLTPTTGPSGVTWSCTSDGDDKTLAPAECR